MNAKLLIRLFLCLAVIQLIIPASMIIKRENVLKHGMQFKFKTAPVDPYDAFRGRYVALNLEENSIMVEKETELKHGQTLFVLIGQGEGGFAKFSGFTLTPPPQGKPYLRAKVRYVFAKKVSGLSTFAKEVSLDLPIDRYYMEESAAPKAEKIYRRHVQGKGRDAYVVVRVKDGMAVIESLYVGGKKIEELVKEQKGS